MNRSPLYLLSFFLAFLGLGLFLYKVIFLNFPLLPSEKNTAWIVETKVSFDVKKPEAVKATLYIPKSSSKFLVVNESFVSRDFGVFTKTRSGNRYATWSIAEAEGEQSLYYRSVVRKRPSSLDESDETKGTVLDPKLTEAETQAVAGIVELINARSADPESFISNLLQLIDENADSNVKFLLGEKPSLRTSVLAATNILNFAGYPARMRSGIKLGSLQKDVPIQRRLEVFNGSRWVSYDIGTGETTPPEEFLPWWIGERDIVAVKGGSLERATISVESYEEDAVLSAVSGGRLAAPLLLEFSLFSLPIEVQAVYRVLLLVPLGALLIVFLRTLIGIKTFGTFMPVLVALAFRETELVWGCILFSFLVMCGLTVRFYFDQLKLLLVPRIGAILSVVVIIMAILSVITHKLGLERGLSVALFPMVVLSMTIERMSVIWDELGAKAAIQQGVGTLLVAAIIFFIVTSRKLEHLLFVFPELLLVCLALTLLMGRYTGYRLLEIARFKDLLSENESRDK